MKKELNYNVKQRYTSFIFSLNYQGSNSVMISSQAPFIVKYKNPSCERAKTDLAASKAKVTFSFKVVPYPIEH